MAYIGSGMEEVEKTVATINMVCDTMVGDGSTTTMTIGATQEVPGSVNNVSVYFDGVCQRPTTDYTLSYKTVTFTTAPENAVKVTCLSYANEFLDVISDATVYSSGIEDNAVTAAKLGSTIASSKLTGTLPALDGSALTGVGVTPITTSASDPTITTNPSGGLGTIWANSTSGEMYVLTDATTDANDWANIGAGEGNFANSFGGNGPGTISGFNSGGYVGSNNTNVTEKFSFSSAGNATDHGDLTNFSRRSSSGHSSKTHGYVVGGMGISGNIHGNSNVIQKFAFASASDAADSGTLQIAVQGQSNSTSYTEGFMAGGNISGHQTRIQKFSLASSASVDNISNISRARYAFGGSSSTTHGYASGGHVTPAPNFADEIDKYAYDSPNTNTDIGNLSQARWAPHSQSSSTHGYTSGGNISGGTTSTNTVDRFSFSSDGNATDHGDLTVARYYTTGQSASTHGYTSGGYTASPTQTNVIDKFAHASNVSGTDVGDMIIAKSHAAGTHY